MRIKKFILVGLAAIGFAAAGDVGLRGGDISALKYVEDLGARFYDAHGKPGDALRIMRENGVNAVRLRLYNVPGTSVSLDGTNYRVPPDYLGERDVLALARRARKLGMKIVLSFHYSDFWTNGDLQLKPSAWRNLSRARLESVVHDYTRVFLLKMNRQGTPPDYVALGNEIQAGLLFGASSRVDDVGGYASASNAVRLVALLNQASRAVRETCPRARIILHLALSERIDTDVYLWFFGTCGVAKADFDIIGTSYYPYWTNRRPAMLTDLADRLYAAFGKDLMVMETGYSWTRYRPSERYHGDWEGQLALNGKAYNEASKAGQKAFVEELQSVIGASRHILGYLYWDPVMVEQKVRGAWIRTCWAEKQREGIWYENGNTVGNATWFDYEGKALPVLEAIREP